MRRLLDWLDAAERSKAWLARKIGVSRGLVQQWEQGRCTPSQEQREAIERVTREWAGPVGWYVTVGAWGAEGG